MLNIPIIGIYYEYFKFFITKRNKFFSIVFFIILPVLIIFIANNIKIWKQSWIDIFLQFISVNNFSNLIWLFSVLVAISAVIYPFFSSDYFKDYIEKNKINKERINLFIKSLKIQLLVIITSIVILSLLVFFKDYNPIKPVIFFLNTFIWINFIALIHDTSYLVINYKK